ncbi:MAG: hypothetical protein QG608_3192 [Actinomycetota bacterium]|nr:hypothetical protein [Actinomycetota bacterium]
MKASMPGTLPSNTQLTIPVNYNTERRSRTLNFERKRNLGDFCLLTLNGLSNRPRRNICEHDQCPPRSPKKVSSKEIVLIGFVFFLITFACLKINEDASSDTDASSANGTPSGTKTKIQAPKSGDRTEKSPDTESSSSTAEDPRQPQGTPSIVASFLSELTEVDSETSDDIDLKFNPVEINGTYYGDSLIYSCKMYCNGSAPQTYEVSLGRKYSKFEAMAGIMDSSSSGPTKIEIEADDRLLRRIITQTGDPKQVNVNVQNVLHLKIKLYPPHRLKSPLEAGADAAGGNNAGGLPGVALGDPRLTP